MEDSIDNTGEAHIPPGIKVGFKQVFTVLRKPTRTFYLVADAGRAWQFPFMIFALVLIIGMILGIVYSDEPPDYGGDFALMSEGEQNALQIVGIIMAFLFVPPSYLLFAYIVPSWIFMLFGNQLMERHLGFRNYLNITAFALSPLIIREIINILTMLITGREIFSYSPQIFLPVELHTSFLGFWLANFSLFTIWILSLLTIGLATVLETTRARIILWLIPLFLAFATAESLFFSYIQRFGQDYGI